MYVFDIYIYIYPACGLCVVQKSAPSFDKGVLLCFFGSIIFFFLVLFFLFSLFVVTKKNKKNVGLSRLFVQRSRSVLREVRVVFVDPTEIFTEMETQKRTFEDKTQRRVESGYFLLARSRRFHN